MIRSHDQTLTEGVFTYPPTADVRPLHFYLVMDIGAEASSLEPRISYYSGLEAWSCATSAHWLLSDIGFLNQTHSPTERRESLVARHVCRGINMFLSPYTIY